MMNTPRAVRALAALAQETRLRLFRNLLQVDADGVTPASLGARLGVHGATLSFHLRHLERAGLVRSWRNGRQVVYAADIDGTRQLMTFLLEDCCQGRPDICMDPLRSPRGTQDNLQRTMGSMSNQAQRTYNVLFLCTGNSARSIMAECALRRYGPGKFNAFSAGSHPKGELHPTTVKLLKNLNYKTDELRSKSWDEFAQPDSPALDFVFTVCDQAAAEVCPIWPGQPMSAHWGVEDPAAFEGDDEDRYRVFKRVYFELENRCKIFANLRIDGLDRLSLGRRLESIGQTKAEPPTA